MGNVIKESMTVLFEVGLVGVELGIGLDICLGFEIDDTTDDLY
jgi:hypothetical protein